MISGQVPDDTSLTCATTIGPTQLSASSVIAFTSGAGTSAIHSTVTSAGAVAVGGVVSSTVMVCVTVIAFPKASVTLYVRVMISGQVPDDTSLTCATTIGPTQLSASSVIAFTSGAGTSAIHSTVTSAGAVAVGGVVSSTVMVFVTVI